MKNTKNTGHALNPPLQVLMHANNNNNICGERFCQEKVNELRRIYNITQGYYFVIERAAVVTKAKLK